ncbi:MAG TPA: serine hydrolase [Actinomycetes bacterium]|nr:serine hydrolase [Actinomycetes bacterium]
MAADDSRSLQRAVDLAVERTPNVTWSIMVRDVSGAPIAQHGASAVCSTASIGKLLLLIEVAHQLDERRSQPAESTKPELTKASALAVADSGLWQHLQAPSLAVEDVAVLVAAVSDNLATNVLLDHVGLATVDSRRAALGLKHTQLHDYVRDERSAGDPPRLSSGNASELSGLVYRLQAGEVISASVSSKVRGWLATGVDLSMVAGAFGVDPLAHMEPDRDIRVWNKTGTNDGVRADVGVAHGNNSAVSYAVLANFEADGPLRDEVLDAMRSLGTALRRVI